jgi:hypothetical protein
VYLFNLDVRLKRSSTLFSQNCLRSLKRRRISTAFFRARTTLSFLKSKRLFKRLVNTALSVCYTSSMEMTKSCLRRGQSAYYYHTVVLIVLIHCSRIADGQWTDDDIPDPLSNMLALLSEKRHRSLVNHWGVWLTKRDPDRALKVRNCVPGSDATPYPKCFI